MQAYFVSQTFFLKQHINNKNVYPFDVIQTKIDIGLKS